MSIGIIDSPNQLGHVDFSAVSRAALSSLGTIVPRLLPQGRRQGREWVARNPTRADARPGSFKINLRTGVWADFATGDKGGDAIDLVAYLEGKSKLDAARALADMLNVAPAQGTISAHAKQLPVQTFGAVAASPEEANTAPRTFPARTLPNTAGTPLFVLADENGPKARDNERRRHIYRQGGISVRIKMMNENGACNVYRVVNDWGDLGWQYAQPEVFKVVPFFVGDTPFDSTANVPIYWPEGEKDVETLARAGLPAFTFGGTGDGLPDGCAEYVVGRHVVILADNDDAGRKHAEDKATAIQGVAACIKVLHFSDLPEKGDVSDWFEIGGTVDTLQARVASTPEWTPEQMIGTTDAPITDVEAVPGDGPIPLFPPLPDAERFPIEMLGPVLFEAAAAISRKVQVPEAIAAQSVLAAAALACQAHADVLLPYGQTRPLSLFFITIAASGDRKSSADNEALWPIRKHEKMLKEEHERDYLTWSIAYASWNAEKKKIEGDRKKDFESRRQALTALGPEPEKPLHPFLTAPEPTIEGLVKAWSFAPAALGIFTAEGGMFIGGHGMSQDNRLRTAAGYSEMWDGHPIKRIRSLDGVSILYGRRLSMHLMVQHEAAAQFLADPLLRDQGLLSRVLVAAPESIAGSRFYKNTAPEDDAAICSYGARILSILEAPWPLAEGRRNELEPRTLTITDEAAITWRAFYDHVEGQCGSGNGLRPIQDFAAKVAEHAARIAGVLTIMNDLHATQINLEAMRQALTLTDWYVNESLRLQRAARTDARLVRAQQLLEWLQEKESSDIGFRDIIQFGPSTMRVKAAAEEALSILTAHGWIVETSSRPRRVRLVQEAA